MAGSRIKPFWADYQDMKKSHPKDSFMGRTQRVHRARRRKGID